MSNITLTPREETNIRNQVRGAVLDELQKSRPDQALYTAKNSRSEEWISNVLAWSRAGVAVIALFALLASAVRTVQTSFEIYSGAGSHVLAAVLAAVGFTISTEGALFIMALAIESDRIREGRPRKVLTLRTLITALGVRLGFIAPEENSGGGMAGPVMAIAFAFAVAANAYLGLKPLVAEIGAGISLQAFIGGLSTASADLQVRFIVDMVAALFPPLMAYAAGHQTASYAALVGQRRAAALAEYDRAVEEWRAQVADPLSTALGMELLDRTLAAKQAAKEEKAAAAAAEEEAARPTHGAIGFQMALPTTAPAPSRNGNGSKVEA